MPGSDALAERLRERKRLVEEGLGRVVETLKRMGAERVVLFGSRAKGKDRAWSDVDLLVVMASELPFVERLGELYRQLLPGFAIDIFAYTPEEFRQGNAVIRQALKEGVVLFARGD